MGWRLESIGPFTLTRLRRLFCDLADAIHFLHCRGVVHRDVKPDNVLLNATETRARLTDFNISMRVDDEPRYNAIPMTDVEPSRDELRHVEGWGTQGYRAPEIYTRSGGNGYVHACDWWSAGATLFEMATGRQPYDRHRCRSEDDDDDDDDDHEENERRLVFQDKNAPSDSAIVMLNDVLNQKLTWPTPPEITKTDGVEKKKRIFYGNEHSLEDEANVQSLLLGLLEFEPSKRLGVDAYNVGSAYERLQSHACFRSSTAGTDDDVNDWEIALSPNDDSKTETTRDGSGNHRFDGTLDARESLRNFEMSMGVFGFEDVDPVDAQAYEAEMLAPTPAQQHAFRRFVYNHEEGPVDANENEEDDALLDMLGRLRPDEMRSFVAQASDDTLRRVSRRVRQGGEVSS